MKRWRLSVLISGALCAGAAQASAQSAGNFAIGGSYLTRLASASSELHHVKGPGLLWRFGHDETRWAWHWGLNWFTTDLDGTVGGSSVELGKLHVRPIMVGYGYTRVFGRTAVTADVLAGYAFTSITLTPQASDAYRDRLGARSITADTTNALTAMPEVSVWFDMSRKIGINVTAGYGIARPRLTVHSTLGEDTRNVRADMFVLKIGAVYSIF